MLNIRLAGRDWLAGAGRGKYSIADINVVPWVRIHALGGIESLDEWPHVKVRGGFRSGHCFSGADSGRGPPQAWVARADARPAFQVGVNVGA